MAVTEQQAIQTLEIVKEEEIAAPIAVVFETILEQMGPYNEIPERGPMPMVLEAWPGGRWFRDLGNNAGHFWGNVQAIKPPTLLEIWGPLFMSYPATSNLQYRLTEENGITRLRFVHRAIGWTATDISEGVQHGWSHMIGRIREHSLRGFSSIPHLGGRTDAAAATEFAPLRIEEHHGMTVAGLKGHFLTGGDPAIPGQWIRFAAHLGSIPRQVGHTTYGIGWIEPAGGLDYMSAVEVREGSTVPGELAIEQIPTSVYAAFAHAGHVSEIPKTMHRALEWLMKNGHQVLQKRGAPGLIERYGEGFDPKSGKGDIELWIPVEK
jgi:predicted transcriptional regulator YdeE/uncharacterized protein YndB with AHSA1/START domain